MNNKIREIMKNYFTSFHIIGIVLGLLLSLLYWYKLGRYSDNIFRNNIFIILTLGILIGYFFFDIINTTRNHRKNDSCENNKK